MLLATATGWAVGELTQKPGTAGCVSELGSGGACFDGKGLRGAASITVSPDGANAYVASTLAPGAVAVLDRVPDGTLTQRPGAAGCIMGAASFGECLVGKALGGANSIAVSPDGTSAYVASLLSDAVAVFDRGADGTLTQKPGTAGCISETGTGGACADGRALAQAHSVTVSPEGASVYVTASLSDAVAVFDRAADGTLTQKPGVAGCISETGTGGECVDGRALDAAASVTVSPDGTGAYVVSESSGAVAAFDRAADGTLTQKPGTAGCISETGTGGACADGRALVQARSVALSRDGANAYVATGGAVAVLDRTADGSLTQKPGTAGCISETGTGGACADGRGLDNTRSVTHQPGRPERLRRIRRQRRARGVRPRRGRHADPEARCGRLHLGHRWRPLRRWEGARLRPLGRRQRGRRERLRRVPGDGRGGRLRPRAREAGATASWPRGGGLGRRPAAPAPLPGRAGDDRGHRGAHARHAEARRDRGAARP